jgi:MoxR-like ATPase
LIHAGVCHRITKNRNHEQEPGRTPESGHWPMEQQMIIVDENSPRWLREMARYVTIKNFLFLYGNIHDLVSFPIQTENEGEVRWTESDLQNFFYRFLGGLKYEIIGWIDPVDDLTFVTHEMEGMFHRIESGRPLKEQKVPAEEENAENKAPTSLPRAGSGPAAPSRRPGQVEMDRTILRVMKGLENTQVPCAFVLNLASRLVSEPDRISACERGLLTKVLKSSLISREVVKEGNRWNNLLILVCDKLNDLPTFLYMNNPRARSIQIEPPDREERGRFIHRYYRHFRGGDLLTQGAPEPLIDEFVDLTEGLTNYEMRSLVNLSVKENIPICDPDTGLPNVRRISEMYKYGITVSEWDKIDGSKFDHAEDFIRARIKGQDNAIARVLDIIKRAKIGLAAGEARKPNRPRGVLFFAGPTGVGKTEMAKTLAELLFGREDRLIRFDMSEYSEPHSDQRLLGAPPGYVGYEEGGQLTNAVKKNPFSILLFDEIEKAHGSLFDKFLQVLDDGRVTDSKGETVYFSECIIIFTSNLGTVAKTESKEGIMTQMLVSPDMPYPRMKDLILEAIRNHFNFVLGRPEILNRFGENFVVFDFIKPPLDQQIVEMLIKRLTEASLATKKIHLDVEGKVRDKLTELARENLQHGGRGIRNVVDSALVNPLSRALFDQNVAGQSTVRVVDLIDNGENAKTRFELQVQIKQPTQAADAAS